MFLIFGKGKSGKAAASLLSSLNLPYYLVDDTTPNWTYFLKRASTVVVSPGIPPHHKVFNLAKDLKKELIGETELAFRFWKGRTVAITGTDGKSTTTRLTWLILKSYLPNVFEGGNIGTSFSEIVAKNRSGLVVLEVSSFQGYTLKSFRPDVGAFLNFSEDHLDWHKNVEDYLWGKYRIFQNQGEEDFAILNANSGKILNTPTRAKKITFGTPNADIKILPSGWVYFKNEKLFEVSKLKLKGPHNVWNAAVAATVGVIFGVPTKVIGEVVYSFEGLPYRIQYLGSFNGINFYNDSKSTTPNALKAALESFDKKVVLIFGGKDKGADYSFLKALFKKKVKFAIAFGENREKLKSTFQGTIPILTAATLEDAFDILKTHLKEGDTVLFSPAAASFDLYSSYKERGEHFNQLVANFKQKNLK